MATETQERLGSALRRLGLRPGRWRDGSVSVQASGHRFVTDVATLEHRMGASVSAMADVELTLRLGGLLGLRLDDALLESLDAVRPVLRPRLLGREVLAGPDRAMCRRDAPGGLVAALSVGGVTSRTFVTTRLLDGWDASFEELFSASMDGLWESIGTDSVRDLEGYEGLLGLVMTEEPAAAISLELEQLLPESDTAEGVVYATPGEDALLMLPVVRDAGATCLAALVHATDALAGERSSPLSRLVLWRRRGRVDVVPMVRIEDEDGRRVAVDAEGVVAELLRVLGEID